MRHLRKQDNKSLRWFLLGLVLYGTIFSIDLGLALFDRAPLFAVEVKTYKDGGTKVYYGLGYKVIRYHVIDGRQDTDFGTWFIQYRSTK